MFLIASGLLQVLALDKQIWIGISGIVGISKRGGIAVMADMEVMRHEDLPRDSGRERLMTLWTVGKARKVPKG